MSRPHDWSYPSCMLNQRDCCQQLSSLTYEECESAPPMQCCEVKDDSPCLSLSLSEKLVRAFWSAFVEFVDRFATRTDFDSLNG